MSKVEFVSIDTDSKKKYSSTSPIAFTLTLNCLEPTEDDLEFEIWYFGDTYSENHNQRIGHYLIDPLERGKQFFKIETTPIDLTRIPIKTLFGLTAILIVGKYRNQQFLRIGYVVNVSYPGISEEQLADSDDKQILGESNEEEIEIMDDDELDNEEEEEEDDDDEEEDDDDEEEEEEEGDDKSCEEEEEKNDTEEGDQAEEDEENDGNMDLASMISPVLSGNHNRPPTPLETPIVADQDEFTYKGHVMRKDRIEMALMEKPIVHLYDIEWSESKNDENIVESSSDEEPVTKKFKEDE